MESVSFSDEILIVDNGSSDQTVSIARDNGARVIHVSNATDFSQLRNRGIESAKNDWILFIDADERVSNELRDEIIDKRQKSSMGTYYIKRRDHWWGKSLRFGEVHRAYSRGFIRLIQKGSGTWIGSVHEVFHTNGAVGRLNAYIDHYPHPTLKDYISDINEYSSRRAQELFRRGKTTSVFEIVSFPIFKFLYTYILLLGFLDGVEGFAYSFLMSFHSFLVRSKLYMMDS